jgi:transposase
VEQHVIGDLLSELTRLDERIALYDHHIAQMAREPRAQQLMLRGSAKPRHRWLAMIGNDMNSRGSPVRSWLGLVPSQYSSGGKARLGHITKAGDPYLRSLLVLGARAVLNSATNKNDGVSQWATALAERRGYWRAIVAIAAKNARMAWAVLSRGEQFTMPA